MDWGAVRFWVGFPEVYDVIAISPHTMLGVPQAGTDFLLLTPWSFSGGKYPISTQTPCLKLNGHPKKPENDAFIEQFKALGRVGQSSKTSALARCV
ncbi:hypothetical protein KU43P_49820 [Pseudomonas sp. KU43P]|nr:hypothetical protein KU43P_49820 [Pseudomonas sp. KU43P]